MRKKIALMQLQHGSLQKAASCAIILIFIWPISCRLLMNMILLMNGYPAAIIRKSERLKYIGSLEKAQLGGSKEKFLKLISRSVERSLDI